ncbi:MAG: hypothetical protein L6R48_09015 [Planctomycetes bacterium]|nr:hypothetical protein [Planctomycetota bacterium]
MAPEVHVIHTTHWDREWVQSAGEYRVRLVELVDDLLDRAEPGPFVLDGQTAAIEDYLALRPERRAEVAAAVAAGRLAIGPWYVLADQFLEGDEAAVRNLLLGTAAAEALGGCQAHGYVPDSFGSIAMLPALLRGFGIASANCGRGIPSSLGRERLFRWRSPDGAEVLAWSIGYANAVGLAYPDIWSHIGWRAADAASAAAASARLLVGEEGRWPVPLRYASAGVDHLPAQPGFAALVAGLGQGARWRLSTPAAFAAAAADASAGLALPLVQGELRGDGEATMDLQGVLSTDAALKRANRAGEWLLGALLEPLDALLPAAGAGARGAVLRQCWRELLQGHAHDSICACCTDAVMAEVHARLRSAVEAAGFAAERWLRAATATRPRRDGDRLQLALAGGLGRPGAHGENLLLRIPGDCPDRLVLRDRDGNARGGATVVARRRMDLETCHAADAALLAVASKDPGPGHDPAQVFALARIEAAIPPGCDRLWAEPGQAAPAAIDAGARHLDNGLLRVEVGTDGRFSLCDRRDGRRWEGLGGFEDDADAGDTYDAVPVAGERPWRSWAADPGAPARASCRLAHHGPACAELEVVLAWRIPARLAEGARRERRMPSGWWRIAAVPGRRSDDTVALAITTRLRLWAGVARLECATTWDNRADHHRLRLALPAPGRPTLASGAHFGATARPWTAAGEPLPCRPLLDWVRRGDGLAVLTAGIYELEARAEAGSDGTLLLGLGRAVDTIGPAAGMNLDVEHARAQGPQRAGWALEPAGDDAAAAQAARTWLTPRLAVAAFAAPGDDPFAALARPPRCHGDGIEITAVKRPQRGDGLVVRVLNRGGAPAPAVIDPGSGWGQARRVALDERTPEGDCQAGPGGKVALSVPAYGLATVRWSPG